MYPSKTQGRYEDHCSDPFLATRGAWQGTVAAEFVGQPFDAPRAKARGLLRVVTLSGAFIRAGLGAVEVSI